PSPGFFRIPHRGLAASVIAPLPVACALPINRDEYVPSALSPLAPRILAETGLYARAPMT
ncbi:MAG: hypothetical protein U9R74_16790, partial [Pseudomonadota bacterium]|nr:hypothetical protein [Pseudomonadota bacterium]